MSENNNGTFLFEDKRWIAFTVIVLVLGTGSLYTRGYFQNDKTRINPLTFSEMELKIVFDDLEPEFLAYIPSERLSSFDTMIGEPVPETYSAVLGYDEAKEMVSESNITISEALWGYTINDFLGGEIKVSGILKKTNSLLDMMHIFSKEKFDGFAPGEKIYVKLTEDKMPKFFYYINSENSNWPKDIEFAQGEKRDFESRIAYKEIIDFNLGNFNIRGDENKTYAPLVLGSEEANMMLKEKIFINVGDKIENLFGRRVFVAGILKPTNTTLDMLHYIPAI